MKCPFCAEDIQDAAILCRFCGADKTAEGKWVPPSKRPTSAPRAKGSFTIKTAGWLFLLSGFFSLVFVTSDVPLFGAMRGGITAFCYNLVFAALFLGIGAGLILGKVWGYRLLLAGTALYSLDKCLFLLNKNTRDAYLAASGVTDQVKPLVDTSMFDQLIVITVLVSVACWWGFAFYIYWRRAYFHGPA